MTGILSAIETRLTQTKRVVEVVIIVTIGDGQAMEGLLQTRIEVLLARLVRAILLSPEGRMSLLRR